MSPGAAVCQIPRPIRAHGHSSPSSWCQTGHRVDGWMGLPFSLRNSLPSAAVPNRSMCSLDRCVSRSRGGSRGPSRGPAAGVGVRAGRGRRAAERVDAGGMGPCSPVTHPASPATGARSSAVTVLSGYLQPRPLGGSDY